jgi:hypothetical protein
MEAQESIRLDQSTTTFNDLVGGLEARQHAIVESVMASVGERLPIASHSDLSFRRLRTCVEEIIRDEISAFRSDSLPASLSAGDERLISEFATLGNLKMLRNTYLNLQKALWEAWLRIVEEHPELEPSRRTDLLALGPDFFFRYVDLLGDHVTAAAMEEMRHLSKGGSRRLFLAVKGLLENDAWAPPLEAYDLRRFHLGLVAWGSDPAAAVRQVAELVERPPLIVPTPNSEGSEKCCWAWLSGAKPLAARQRESLSTFSVGRAHLAVGLELAGIAGFRSTHRQAVRARDFGLQGTTCVTRYEDVAVEALACENPTDAAAFVARELRGIDDDSPTSRRLRDTLRAYFCADYNAASAAAALGVHQQTVANRLRTVEERLGHASIGLRRVELEVALRLRECLPAASSGSA